MIFKQIVDKVTWEDVKAELLRYYYRMYGSVDGVDYEVEDYYDVLYELRSLNPIKSIDNMKLYIRDCENGDFSVFGKNGKSYNDVPEYSYNIYFSSPDKRNEECVFDLEFYPWEEWMGMDISIIVMALFNRAEIVAYSLIEIASRGWTQEEIREANKHQKELDESQYMPLLDFVNDNRTQEEIREDNNELAAAEYTPLSGLINDRIVGSYEI